MPWWAKAIAGLAFVFFMSRGGFAFMGPLLKVAIPLAAAYYVFKSVKNLIAPSEMEDKKQDEKLSEPIKICPNCGQEITKCGGCDGTTKTS